LKAVSVADGDDGEAGGTGGAPALVVANSSAGSNVTQGNDASLPVRTGAREARSFGSGAFPLSFAGQVVAVERESGADHVVPGIGTGNGGGRVAR